MEDVKLLRQGEAEPGDIDEEVKATDESTESIVQKEAEALVLQKEAEALHALIVQKEAEALDARAALYAKLEMIGNLVHDSVPVSDDVANNAILRSWGEKRSEPNLRSHVELLELLGIGAHVAGSRGFYLKGAGVLLSRALIRFGFDFLEGRGYTALKMCAGVAPFDEQLYKVTEEADEKCLIATAEQPLWAYHLGNWIHPSQLPLRYAGLSSCFHKEAGSHGPDSVGILHQFEKLEQFCVTSPIGNESWHMHEAMIQNSEEFYQLLKIPYRVVAIVSGALNAAAAKTCGLEGWFPASNAYRELAFCSNCTDYQSRGLGIRYGQEKGNEQAKQYVHLLNSTLAATDTAMCCILENYQKEDGVEIPAVLQRFMGGRTFMPFVNTPPATDAKGKKSKA